MKPIFLLISSSLAAITHGHTLPRRSPQSEPAPLDAKCGIPGGTSLCTHNQDTLIKVDASATTAEACAPICRAEPACKSYGAGIGGCWLYSADVEICKGLPGVPFWSYSDRNCYPTQPDDSCDRPGGASSCSSNRLIKRVSSATSARGCAPICRAEPTCKSYAAGSDGCWLYSADVDTCEGASGGSGWTYSDRNCYATDSDDSCSWPGGVSPCTSNGSLIKRVYSARSARGCAPLCRAEPTCKSYAAGSGGCWLYSGDVDICKGASGGSGWTYSNRDCYPTLDDSCNLPGGVSRRSSTKLIKRDTSAKTARSCAPICRANPACMSYAAGSDGCWLYSGDVDICKGASGGSGWTYSNRNCYLTV